MMKRNTICLYVLMVAALVFGSCYSYPINLESMSNAVVIWDNDLPREECVELFLFGAKATEYNGISVDWADRTLVILPPGDTVLALSVTNSYMAGYIGNNLPFRWKFEAGQRYQLQPDIRDDKSGILLFDADVKQEYEDQLFYTFPATDRTVLN